MRLFLLSLVILVGPLAGCSKAPLDSALDTMNAVSGKFMGNLVQKDASRQVERLIRNIDQRPECQSYIDRLREAGHGSPYQGATEYAIVHANEDARKAGCAKT